MKIEFVDPKLAAIRTDRAAAELKLPIGVIKSCREKLIVIEDAPDERVLREWKSLKYKKLHGNRDGQREVRLNDQYRIVFILDESQSPPIIKILEIGDIHS
jgi:proteic killer suppression protein